MQIAVPRARISPSVLAPPNPAPTIAASETNTTTDAIHVRIARTRLNTNTAIRADNNGVAAMITNVLAASVLRIDRMKQALVPP